jgi:ABC-type glycerol-3-phosphate transport system substrate-binding protein
LGGWSIGINSHSEKKDDAFRFLSWTATNEIATCITLTEGQTAVNSIFENDELVTLYPWLPLYKRAYKDTVLRLPPYLNGKQIVSQKDIDSIIYQHALALLHDKHDVTDTIAKTHDDLSRLFEKR